MRQFIFAVFATAALFAAQQTNAASVTVILDLSIPGAFDIFLSDSLGDNDGIASYGIPVTGVFDTLDHNSVNSPFAQDGAFVGGTAGFSFLRSADGVALLGASQDTITPTPHLINGFGQTASDFATEGLNPVGGAPDGTSWGAELLIASGTYSGDAPGVDVSPTGGAFSNIFLTGGGIEAAVLDLITRTEGQNTPPVITDMFVDIPVGSVPFDQQTLATFTNPANYQMLATDAEDVSNDLTWSLDSFTGPLTALGSPLPGAGNGNEMFGTDGVFTWDPVGSAHGFYFAGVTVTDTGGLMDMGILRVQVPEPSTFILAGLSLVGVFASRRRNG